MERTCKKGGGELQVKTIFVYHEQGAIYPDIL
jgi:hypothetical protein